MIWKGVSTPSIGNLKWRLYLNEVGEALVKREARPLVLHGRLPNCRQHMSQSRRVQTVPSVVTTRPEVLFS